MHRQKSDLADVDNKKYVIIRTRGKSIETIVLF